MLKIEGIHAGYESGQVLQGVDLALEKGDILGVVGRNGMGKSTLLKSVMGLVRPSSGRVQMNDKELTHLSTAQIARAGLGYVPQGRGLFADLTVRENIRLAQLGARDRAAPDFDALLSRFSIVGERADSRAGTLSGGQQQQVALARALAGGPHYLLLDEPSEGIQPSLVLALAESLLSIAAEGRIGIILVEQNVELLRRVVTSSLVLEKGGIVARYGREETRHPGTLEKHLAL